jgi:hypothetical protein
LDCLEPNRMLVRKPKPQKETCGPFFNILTPQKKTKRINFANQSNLNLSVNFVASGNKKRATLDQVVTSSHLVINLAEHERNTMPCST